VELELQPGDPARIGRYRLIKVLGSGAMGRVYLGESPAGSPGRRLVAVRVIRADLAADAEFRRHFRREVAAAKAVQGPCTATVAEADNYGAGPIAQLDASGALVTTLPGGAYHFGSQVKLAIAGGRAWAASGVGGPGGKGYVTILAT
jgi:hypothetical protein